MKIYNVSDGKPYYSQKNNLTRAEFACNVTSMVASLNYMGYSLPVDPNYKQPEDALLNFILNSKEVDDYYSKFDSFSYKQYISSGKDYKKTTPPNENHTVLSYGVNLWLNKKNGEVTKFTTSMKVSDILFETVSGRPVVVSGLFNNLHHVVTLVGFVTNQEEVITSADKIDFNKIQRFIVDDPYGDFKTNYSVADGNNVTLTVEQFKNMVNPIGNSAVKWAHTFKKV